MPMSGRILVALLALALAAPVTAFAQSAGDEQYTDPFQDVPGANGGAEGNSGSQGGQGNTGSGQGGDQGEPVAPTEPVVPEESGVTEAPATSTPALGGDGAALPRTGLPAAALAVLGMLLVAGGVSLRWAAQRQNPV
jgi:hypothetical protein